MTVPSLTAYGENRGEGTVTGQITAKDTAAYNASPTAGIVFQGHYASNNAQAIFASITGFKETQMMETLLRFLAFHTRKNGSVAQERVRIGSNGSVGIGTDYLSGNATVYHKLMVEGDTTSTMGLCCKYC